jgi:hypothetical protein
VYSRKNTQKQDWELLFFSLLLVEKANERHTNRLFRPWVMFSVCVVFPLRVCCSTGLLLLMSLLFCLLLQNSIGNSC